MQSTATTPEAYIESLPEDRKNAVLLLRKAILDNIPPGFEEVMSYGMLGYVVPHSLYPKGYHCDPKLPLPFMNIASQKNFIAVYHMGMYANKQLLAWMTAELQQQLSTKPDIGKSCMRFKKMETIPFALIGELAGKMTTEEWITCYETTFRK